MDFFSAFISIYKSVKAMGSIRNSTDPVLSFIDCITKYSDFTIIKNKPKQEDMQDNLVYFFINRNGELAYLTKKMDYSRPVNIKREDFQSLKDFRNNSIYDKIRDLALGKNDSISTLTKGAIYKFLLKKGKFTAGVKYFIFQKIKLPYRLFEKKFIAKFPLIYSGYKKLRNTFTNICVFCASETGMRTLAITTAVGLAITTGGTFFIVSAAVFTASVAFSIIRQSYYKMHLNTLKEEAVLLEKYCNTYKQKLELSKNKNIFFKDNFYKEQKYVAPKPESAVSKWMKASYAYFSTYIFEVAVPVAMAFLNPGGVAIELAIITGSASITSGVGVFFRKVEYEKKALLRDAIDKAQEQNFIPPYRSLQELREYVKMQENQVQALKLMKDKLSPKEAIEVFNHISKYQDCEVPKVSTVWSFGKAMYEIVNPYDRTKEVKDEREVKYAVEDLKQQVVEVNQQHFKYLNQDKPKPHIDINDIKSLGKLELSKSRVNHQPYVLRSNRGGEVNAVRI